MIVPLLPVLLLAVACDSTKPGPTTAQSPADKIVDLTDDERIAGLMGEYEQSMRASDELLSNAKTANERTTAIKTIPNIQEYTGKMLEIIVRNPKSQQSFKTLLWIVDEVRLGDTNRQALSLIQEHHLDNQDLSELCLKLSSNTGGHIEKFLESVAAKSPHRDVRAVAIYSLSKNLDFTARCSDMIQAGGPQSESTRKLLDPETIDYLMQFNNDARRSEQLLRQVLKEYPDVKLNDQPMSEIASQALDYLKKHSE